MFYLKTNSGSEAKSEDPVLGVNLLRLYIESIDPDGRNCMEWEEEFYDKYHARLIERQTVLIERGVIELIVCNVESFSNNDNVFERTLNLMVGILFGGNGDA